MGRGVVVFSLQLLSGFEGAWALPRRCLYRSSLPGAVLVSRETNIIVRFDGLLSPAALSPGVLSVQGSLSGDVRGQLKQADDGQTLLFAPAAPFAYDETVSVSFSPTKTDGDDGGLPSLSWTFHTARRLGDRGFSPAAMLRAEIAQAVGERKAELPPAPNTSDLPATFPQIIVDARGFAIAVDFCRLSTDGFIATKKLLLLR